MFKNKTCQISEENVKIPIYSSKISKKQKVFYNPIMKLNRDLSLIFIYTYFTKYNNKKIKFCDPMIASGIRELRFLEKIPQIFNRMYLGDISKSAIKDFKKNAKLNRISLKNIIFTNQNAINTINQEYFDFIEIDPFGSPVPFLDIALQRIKHNGILSVTATDTAALCGTYPKTTLRKYQTKVQMTHFYDELGLRNLIAYCQREAAKYEKKIIPYLCYSQDHYYKIFFKVEESRTDSLNSLKQHKYFKWNKKTQEIAILEYEERNSIGKTYIDKLNNKQFIKDLIKNIDLIEENKKVTKLLKKLNEELDTFGYINPDKLQKENNFSSKIKQEILFKKLKNLKYQISKAHNSKNGIKTNAPIDTIIETMQKYKNT